MKSINITVNCNQERERVKNWLNEYRFAKNHIATLKGSIESTSKLLEEAMDELAKDKEAVNQEEVELVAQEVKKMKAVLLDSVKDFNLKYARIFIVVNNIPDPEIREVISDHYFKNHTLQAIALDMDVSLSKAKYLHRAGLDYLADKV